MKLHKKVLCISGIGILLAGTNLFAAEKSASEIINNAYKHMGSLDKYTFDAVVSEDETKGEHFRQDLSVKVYRPGKIVVSTNGKAKNKSFYLNDGVFTMMDYNLNYYGSVEAEKSIDDTLDFLFEKYGIKIALSSLLYSDMNQRVKFKKSKYFGTRDVAGVECDYVAFKSNIGDVHVWITTGENPLVKTYSIISTGDDFSRRNTTLVWNTNPNTTDSDFVFTAPKGASNISVKPAE
ncbi:MAG: DUF2092 domain-containing protein [Bacteroidales bacterium]|nr:DUF2092 domain-containing protein [Bacteroidales bacterium]